MGLFSKLTGGSRSSHNLRIVGPPLGSHDDEKLKAMLQAVLGLVYERHGSRIAHCQPFAAKSDGKMAIMIKTTNITEAEAAELEKFTRDCLEQLAVKL